MFIRFFYLVTLSIIYQCKCINENENEKNCRTRRRLISTDNGNVFLLIEVIPGEELVLQCHFCKEEDDQRPKIWYAVKSFNHSVAQEVHLGMNSKSTQNRVLINLEHSLIFREFLLNDTGFYYCIGLESRESENKFSYLVDAVFEDGIAAETGNIIKWRQYYDQYLEPANMLFKTSNNNEFIYIREKLYISVQLVTEWENWGPCEICGRSQGNGIRRRKGLCRFKLARTNHTSLQNYSEDEIFFLNSYQISCRSMLVARLFPFISNLTRFLPHFIESNRCEGICNPDAEGSGKGWKSGKTHGFKYKKSYVLAEKTHLTLICPESTIDNTVIWRKNGKILKSGESRKSFIASGEPRITIDTFNTLYLHDVTSEEEGNYTCQVNDIKMQQVKVFVVSKSRILTHAFVRHMMYLAFILSLTFTCYCAGLFIAWTKRHTFKTYEELVEENTKHFVDNSDED